MTLTCPKCKQENRDSARFCQFCGAQLRVQQICARCGTENPPNARFCIQCAAPLSTPVDPSLHTGAIPPATLLGGRYSIMRKLGHGGMGAVYLVSDVRLSGKLWAVKEMSDAAITDPLEKQNAVQAFKHEAALLATLEHPNLTKVVDFFADLGKHFLVMDYIEGQTLAELLQTRQKPFSEHEVLPWAEQLCHVLHYLHSRPQPIIFRDLKPGNIMLDRMGRVKLIDFGIARLFKPGKQRDTMSYGTSGYAPPEQYGKGQTDVRSDIYALGATLHHLLTLRDPADQPFRFPSIRSLNPSVSAHVDEAIMKAVEQEPEKRWQCVDDFAAALCAASQPANAPVPHEEAVSLPPTRLAAPPTETERSSPTPAPVPQSPDVTRAMRGVKRSALLPTILIFLCTTALAYFWISIPWFHEMLFSSLGETLGIMLNTLLPAWIVLLAPMLTKRPGMAFLPTALASLILGVGEVTYVYAAGAELLFAITRYRKYNIWVYFLSLVSATLVSATFAVRAWYGIFNFYLPEILGQLLGITIAAGSMAILDRRIFRI